MAWPNNTYDLPPNRSWPGQTTPMTYHRTEDGRGGGRSRTSPPRDRLGRPLTCRDEEGHCPKSGHCLVRRFDGDSSCPVSNAPPAAQENGCASSLCPETQCVIRSAAFKINRGHKNTSWKARRTRSPLTWRTATVRGRSARSLEHGSGAHVQWYRY